MKHSALSIVVIKVSFFLYICRYPFLDEVNKKKIKTSIYAKKIYQNILNGFIIRFFYNRNHKYCCSKL